MKSSLIIEVHDSICASAREEEKEDLRKILVKVMEAVQWPWQRDVPRGCDLMAGINWGEMKAVKI
jgi:DNA polymerase I-like protein with 3'-5' exonuclease and polymerase domains